MYTFRGSGRLGPVAKAICLSPLIMAGMCTHSPPAVVCTPRPMYSEAVQTAAAKELAEFKERVPNLARFVNDYRRVRKAIEACERAQ